MVQSKYDVGDELITMNGEKFDINLAMIENI